LSFHKSIIQLVHDYVIKLVKVLLNKHILELVCWKFIWNESSCKILYI